MRYDGDTAIDGVPGRHAPVIQAFLNTEGSQCGLFPTGRTMDEIAGVPCTLIDNRMPVVVMPAAAFGLSGYEDNAALEANAALKDRLEELRLKPIRKSLALGHDRITRASHSHGR